MPYLWFILKDWAQILARNYKYAEFYEYEVQNISVNRFGSDKATKMYKSNRTHLGPFLKKEKEPSHKLSDSQSCFRALLS